MYLAISSFGVAAVAYAFLLVLLLLGTPQLHKGRWLVVATTAPLIWASIIVVSLNVAGISRINIALAGHPDHLADRGHDRFGETARSIVRSGVGEEC